MDKTFAESRKVRIVEKVKCAVISESSIVPITKFIYDTVYHLWTGHKLVYKVSYDSSNEVLITKFYITYVDEWTKFFKETITDLMDEIKESLCDSEGNSLLYSYVNRDYKCVISLNRSVNIKEVEIPTIQKIRNITKKYIKDIKYEKQLDDKMDEYTTKQSLTSAENPILSIGHVEHNEEATKLLIELDTQKSKLRKTKFENEALNDENIKLRSENKRLIAEIEELKSNMKRKQDFNESHSSKSQRLSEMHQGNLQPQMHYNHFPPPMHFNHFPPPMNYGLFPPPMHSGLYPPMHHGLFPPPMQQESFQPPMHQESFDAYSDFNLPMDPLLVKLQKEHKEKVQLYLEQTSQNSEYLE